MSSSAKPVEKVFKSLLAVVLAVALCPLAPAGQAQAQETEENGSEASAMSMPVDESDAQPSGLDDDIALQSAESSDPIVDWTTCGTARWMIDASGCLVIAPLEGEESGELGYWDYREEAPWYSRRQAITSVKVDGHVAAQTTYSMFGGCPRLTFLDLSGLDTSKVEDMSYMFGGCSRLVTIYASASFSTASVASCRSMFSGCSRLTGGSGTGYDSSYDGKERARIDSPGAPGYFTDKSASAYAALYGDGSLVFQAGPEAEEGRGALVAAYPFHLSGTAGGTAPWSGAAASVKSASFSMGLAPSSMRGWFSGMSSLESVDLTNLDTSKVTDMSSMFSGCSSLASLDLSGLDTSKVTDMSSMFRGCSSLQPLGLSSLDTSKVTDMSSMFRGCSSLASLDLSSFDTSKVIDMTSMFDGCSSLASLDLSSFDTSNVTKMGFSLGRDGGMFYGCSSLTTLDLSSFDTSKVTDMSCMFEGCSRLVTIYASASFSTGSVKDSEDMFYGCSRLTGGFGTRCPNVNWSGTAYFDKARARIDAPGEPGYFTDKDVAYAALYEDGELVFQAGADPEGGHGALSAAYPFRLSDGGAGKPSWSAAAGSVRSVSFSAALAPSSLRGWFSGMSSLESVDLTNLDTSKVTDMGLMFYGCSSLSSLDLSTFDTSKVTDMSSVFEGCSGLRSVSLGGRFSFSGATGSRLCSLPTPSGNEYSGLWESSADGEAYAPDEVPDNVAATYTARKVKTDLFEARASVSDIPDQTYTGSAIEPKVTVTLDGKKLVLGVDYTVSYANNVEVGTAVATIVGIGDYEGTIQKEFTIAAAPARTFPDVDYSSWYGDAVTFVSEKGLITGYADSGEFGPLDTLTRGQLATILWRNACPDEAASYDASEAVNETGLSGVDDHEYYTAAANWAVREGIITGFEREDGTYDFAASSPVSFEQLITILSRLGATSDEVAAAGDDLSEFLDGDNASPWSRSPIAWAAEKGLVGGYENEDGTRTLAPGEDVSRGRAATVLMRAFDLGIMG